ncbi:MAG: isoprenoid biosynthesis glyoxalase ElbB [Bacteroidales bacterium]|nr:isoprenoid biosynthesis glyoxalase ElbB [Bacteroidales bacterium]MCF8454490.1 isoprenoid biosynthesis glyoxalase ElbB [Bacteroidales bacterium]
MSNPKKLAVILSGCGVYDGAEIHEATLTLYSIMKQGATYEIFAPDVKQAHVVNHLTGEEMAEERNVLVESARIARGAVKNLKEYDASEFDALILPGGFGAAKNLSNFAFAGTDMNINPDVEKAIGDTVKAKKPIGALCIAPVILAKMFPNIGITIGQDGDTAEVIESLGAVHHETTHGEVIVDEEYKVATTPCYMLDANILQIAEGADNVVREVLGMT